MDFFFFCDQLRPELITVYVATLYIIYSIVQWCVRVFVPFEFVDDVHKYSCTV